MVLVPPNYPNQVWDGLTPNSERLDREQSLSPNQHDWDQAVAELIATQEYVNDLESRVGSGTGLNWRGNWVPGVAYAEHDAVAYLGSSYIAVSANQNDPPPSANWNLLAQGGSGGTDYYDAEADEAIANGAPIYLTAAGHAGLAQATGVPQTRVAGFSVADTGLGLACPYITEGVVSLPDWTGVAGTASLTPGSAYFLDPSAPGRITTTAPSASGRYVVRVGRAVSALNLDVEIEPPIRL